MKNLRERYLSMGSPLIGPKVIDGFISELWLATNIKDFSHDLTRLESEITFDNFEMYTKYANRIQSSFSFECSTPKATNQSQQVIPNDDLLIPRKNSAEEPPKSESSEHDQDEFFSLFYDQKSKEKKAETNNGVTINEQSRPFGKDVIGDCSRFEKRVQSSLVSSKKRKVIGRLAVLHNRSLIASDNSRSAAVKEVVVNCLYLDSNNNLSDPEVMNEDFKVPFVN